MSVIDVLVTIGKATFDLWNTGGVFTIAGGTDEVLAQTLGENFHTSDFGNVFAPVNSIQPTIKIDFSFGTGPSQSMTLLIQDKSCIQAALTLSTPVPVPGRIIQRFRRL